VLPLTLRRRDHSSEELVLFQDTIEFGHYRSKAIQLVLRKTTLHGLVEFDHCIATDIAHLFAFCCKVDPNDPLIINAGHASDQSFSLHVLKDAHEAPAFHAHFGPEFGAGCALRVYAQEDLPDRHGATILASLAVVQPRYAAPHFADRKVDGLFWFHAMRRAKVMTNGMHA